MRPIPATTLSAWCLCLGAAHAVEIFDMLLQDPVSSYTVPSPSGIASLPAIPFTLDIPLVDKRTRNRILDAEYNITTWDARAAVTEGETGPVTFLDLSWQDGEGPNVERTTTSQGVEDMPWNACVVSVPALLNVTHFAPGGNGSCLDLASFPCLGGLASAAYTMWSVNLADTRGPEGVAKTCAMMSQWIWLPQGCAVDEEAWRASTNEDGMIEAYAYPNPGKGKPFLVAVDNYGPDGNKSEGLQKAIDRPWPIILLQAQGNFPVGVSIACPYAGLNNAGLNNAEDTPSTAETSASASDAPSPTSTSVPVPSGSENSTNVSSGSGQETGDHSDKKSIGSLGRSALKSITCAALALLLAF